MLVPVVQLVTWGLYQTGLQVSATCHLPTPHLDQLDQGLEDAGLEDAGLEADRLLVCVRPVQPLRNVACRTALRFAVPLHK